MSFRSRFSLPLTLAIAMMAAGCQPFPVFQVATGTSGSPAPTASTTVFSTDDLRGRVLVPVIAAGGDNVIAAGGANVVAAGGANVVAPGGGNVIAPGGGNVIAPGGGNVIAAGGMNYRVAGLAGTGELPVFGAVVVLRDPVTRQRLPWVAPVFTDEKGEFTIKQVPAGVNYLVDVTFLTPDRKVFRLLSVARAGQPADVDWCTTVVASTILEGASKGTYAMDAQAMNPAVDDIDRMALTMAAAQRDARMTAAVTAPTTAPTGNEQALIDASTSAQLRDRLSQLGRPKTVGTLVVPDVLADVVLGARSVGQAMVKEDATFAGHIGQLKQAAAASTGSSIVTDSLTTLLPALPLPRASASTSSSTSGGSGSTSSSGGGSTSSAGTTVTNTAAGVTAPIDHTVSTTVDASGNTVTTAVDTTGNAVTTVVDTAGTVVSATTSTTPAPAPTPSPSPSTGLIETIVNTTTGTVGGVL